MNNYKKKCRQMQAILRGHGGNRYGFIQMQNVLIKEITVRDNNDNFFIDNFSSKKISYQIFLFAYVRILFIYFYGKLYE